jgi:large subunit ribosomal protein L24
MTSPVAQQRLLQARLADDLRSKYGRRTLRVRKGDTVKVLRGEYSGVEAKVTAVDSHTGRLSIEGVTREKIAGGTVPVRIHISKVMVTTLNLDDPWRKNSVEGKETS